MEIKRLNAVFAILNSFMYFFSGVGMVVTSGPGGGSGGPVLTSPLTFYTFLGMFIASGIALILNLLIAVLLYEE